MIRYSVETKLTPEQVIERARSYFADKGLSEEATTATDSVTFSGGGGFVHVAAEARPGGRRTDVILEAREWEEDVRRFIQKIT